MKKVLCLLVALLLVGTIAFADPIDWSLYTDEQLTIMKNYIEAELYRRSQEEGNPNSINPWYDYGVGQYLPSFVEATGNSSTKRGIAWNDNNSFAEQFEGVSEEDFKAYCDAVNDWGYNIDKSTTYASYEASNSNGISIHMYLIGNLMTVEAEVKK